MKRYNQFFKIKPDPLACCNTTHVMAPKSNFLQRDTHLCRLFSLVARLLFLRDEKTANGSSAYCLPAHFDSDTYHIWIFMPQNLAVQGLREKKVNLMFIGPCIIVIVEE